MFQITLKNGKKFTCNSSTTIYEAARNNGITLNHSCLTARCRSCVVQIKSGSKIDKLDDLVLTADEKSKNWALSCNSIPTSDLVLETEDLAHVQFFEKQIIPVKIQSISQLSGSVIELSLRLPPNSNFVYNSGQYVNIIKGSIRRSYSISNAYQNSGLLTFFIRKYENGFMSNYLFSEAQVNDLLRIEGPLGSFFLRDSEMENIIFLATGTGVAPIKSILESLDKLKEKFANKKIWVFIGARYMYEIFWDPSELNGLFNFTYIPVLSKGLITVVE